MSDPTLGQLPLDRLLKANEVCNRFEDALRSGAAVSVDDFLATIVEGDRAIVRQELEAILRDRSKEAGPPAEIGEYVLEGELGRGAMGQVRPAVHRTMKRHVAIKFLHATETDRQAAADQRFQREVEILAQLQHPNLVSAFDAGRIGAWRYLVTELIDGIDLASWVKKHGPMPAGQVLDVLEQICLGLEHLHGRGIIHRDLKPANVMIDKTDRVRILDVGLARTLTEEGGGLTRPGWILGTVDYMAPEQADGAHQADARSDLYSLGCTLYFLLQGKPPYPGRTLVDALVAHREQPIPDLGANIEPELQEFFKTLVAKDPRDRYASSAEALTRLRTIRQTRSSTDRTQVIQSPRHARRSSLAPYWLLGLLFIPAAGVAIIVISILGFWLFHRTRPPAMADNPLADAADYQRRWARHFDLPVTVTDETGLAFAFIPPGRFQMGTSDEEIAILLAKQTDPDKRLRIEAEKSRPMEIKQPYYLGTTEVTIGQFRRFIDATWRKTHAEEFGSAWGIANGKWMKADAFFWDNLGEHPKSDDLPVFNITCDEAEGYCHWLNSITKRSDHYRLPVEAEWEYACRAGSTTPFFGGDHTTLQRYAWFADNSGKMRISPVGKTQPNAFGLFDMHGNHGEWCGIAPRDSPLFTPIPGDNATDRPSRGGHFFETADRVRSAARDWGPANSMGKGGFRVLKEIRD